MALKVNWSGCVRSLPGGMLLLGLAVATPALPSPSVALKAVKAALGTPAASVKANGAGDKGSPVRAVSKPATAHVRAAQGKPAQPPLSAAAARARGVALAAQTRRPARSLVVRSTAYNSLPRQTDSTPFITATGTRVRFGTVALSRDLLRQFPYGTRVSLEDLSGRYDALLGGRTFVVEDTMHARMVNTVDVWMSTQSQALAWGHRDIRITALP